MARSLDVDPVVRGASQALLFLTPVVVVFGLRDVVQLPKATLAVVVAFLLVLWISIQALRDELIPLPPRTFMAAVLVFLGASVVAVLTAESTGRGLVGSYARWSGFSVYAACAVVALVIAGYFSVSSVVRLLRVLAGSTFVVAVYGIVQYVGLDPLAWDSPYGSKVFSTLGNPNFAAAFLGLGVPVWLWLGITAKRWGRQALAGAVVLAHLVVQVWTGSVQGPAVSLIALWAFGLVMTGRLGAWRRRARFALGSAAALGAVGVVAGLTDRGPLSAVDWSSMNTRFRFWGTGVEMFLDRPLVGFGFTGYSSRYREYRSREEWEEVGFATATDVPHSVPIDMFVSGGLLLGLSYLLVLAVVTLTLMRASNEVGSDKLPVVAAVAGAWFGYASQLFISIDVPPLAVVGWMIAGVSVAVRPRDVDVISLRRPSRVARKPRLGELIVVGGLITVLGLGAWTMIGQFRADRKFAIALTQGAGNPPLASQALTDAQRLAPWEPRYVREQGDVLYSTGQPEEALERYEAATIVDPHWLDAHVVAARLSDELGDWERSSAWYDRVIELDPVSPEFKVEAAEVAMRLGDSARAVRLLEGALEVSPDRPEWWLLLSEARAASGDDDGAEAARKRAIDLDPSLAEPP